MSFCEIMGVSAYQVLTPTICFLEVRCMSVMGIVQSESCSLVYKPGAVRWVSGLRLFAGRFASANVRVAAESAGAGNVEAVG